jgi:hypothetical protein
MLDFVESVSRKGAKTQSSKLLSLRLRACEKMKANLNETLLDCCRDWNSMKFRIIHNHQFRNYFHRLRFAGLF